MFEKVLFLFIGAVTFANFALFILSVYYSINLFNSSYEKILEFQGLFWVGKVIVY